MASREHPEPIEERALTIQAAGLGWPSDARQQDDDVSRETPEPRHAAAGLGWPE